MKEEFRGCEHEDCMDILTKKRRRLLFDIAIYGDGKIRLDTLRLLRNTYGLTKIYHDGKEIELDKEIANV